MCYSTRSYGQYRCCQFLFYNTELIFLGQGKNYDAPSQKNVPSVLLISYHKFLIIFFADALVYKLQRKQTYTKLILNKKTNRQKKKDS